MFAQDDNPSMMRTRREAAEEIHRAMSRFPLIVETLRELAKTPVPLPGDADIHHGCQRALTSILVNLARIEPAPPGKSSKHEEAALEMLQGKSVARLIDADQLERMHQFIESILGPQTHHH